MSAKFLSPMYVSTDAQVAFDLCRYATRSRLLKLKNIGSFQTNRNKNKIKTKKKNI